MTYSRRPTGNPFQPRAVWALPCELSYPRFDVDRRWETRKASCAGTLEIEVFAKGLQAASVAEWLLAVI